MNFVILLIAAFSSSALAHVTVSIPGGTSQATALVELSRRDSNTLYKAISLVGYMINAPNRGVGLQTLKCEARGAAVACAILTVSQKSFALEPHAAAIMYRELAKLAQKYKSGPTFYHLGDIRCYDMSETREQIRATCSLRVLPPPALK